MTTYKKFINAINFSEDSIDIKNSLLALAYQELQKESEAITAKLGELSASRKDIKQLTQYKKKQKETNDAMAALRQAVNVDLDAPVNIGASAVFAFAKNLHNLKQLADILSDAPAAIKHLQTQLYIEVMSQLGQAEQEVQLKKLSFANIKDLIEQAILLYEAAPDDIQLHNQYHEIIHHACEITKKDHPDHYNEYLDFLFSLRAKVPASPIIDTIISRDIEETLTDVRKRAISENSTKTQRKLAAAQQDILCDDRLNDTKDQKNSVKEGILQSVIASTTKTVHLYRITGDIKHLDILFTYPSNSTEAQQVIAVLDKVLPVGRITSIFLQEQAPGRHLLKACITHGQNNILNHFLGKITQPNPEFIAVVKEDGLLPYATEQGMTDVFNGLVTALKKAGASEQEISNLMAQEYDSGNRQIDTTPYSQAGVPEYFTSVSKNISPTGEIGGISALSEPEETHVVRALVDLKPLKEPTLFEDDHIIREKLNQYKEDLLSALKAKKTGEIESVDNHSDEENENENENENEDIDFEHLYEDSVSSFENEAKLNEWLDGLGEGFEDISSPLELVQDEAKFNEWLDSLGEGFEDISNPSELAQDEDKFNEWLDSLGEGFEVPFELDEPQSPDYVIDDELELLDSLSDEEMELLFSQGKKTTANELLDQFISSKPDLEINLKKIDGENVKKLLQFFDSQAKQGIKAWKKGQIYTFEDGTEFTFKNDVFQRARKKGHEGVRYEAISNKAIIGEGAFGKVKRVKGTIALDSEQEAIKFKKHGKDGKRRVVKIQEHSEFGDNPLSNVRKEFEFAKRAEHLAIKEPTVVENSQFSQTSYTVMKEITGRELFDIIQDDNKGIYVLSTQQRIELTTALLLALKEQVTDKNLIHRDIKPENIKVDLGPPIAVKILDYGVSTDIPDGEIVGTPGYYAPEIASDPMSISAKSDVYSMARVIALIWRVNYATYPVDSYTPWSYTPEKILTDIFTDINDLIEEEEIIIAETLFLMLKNDPAQRYSIDEAINSFAPMSEQVVEVVAEVIEEPEYLEVEEETENGDHRVIDKSINTAVSAGQDKAKERDPVKDKALGLFTTALETMLIKIADLSAKAEMDCPEKDRTETNRHYEVAANKGFELLGFLQSAGYDFFEAEKPISPEKFKERCDAAINEARSELGTHRGWSKLLADITFITVSVCTGGFANIVSKVATGSFRFFSAPKTDAEQQLDVLDANLKSIKLKG